VIFLAPLYEMIHIIDYEGVDATGSRKGLRYNPPDVSGLDIADFLSQQELDEALWNNLDENSDAWLQVSAALVIKDRRLDGRDGESDAEMEGEGDNAGASLTTTTTLGATRRTIDDCYGGRDLTARGARIVIY
jgi:hypothetical protein